MNLKERRARRYLKFSVLICLILSLSPAHAQRRRVVHTNSKNPITFNTVSLGQSPEHLPNRAILPAEPAWAYNRLNLGAAANAGLSGKGVNILVIDTGVTCDAELDCSEQSIALYIHPKDYQTHGTAIVKAIKSNGKIKGAAPGAKILSYAINFTGTSVAPAEINRALDFAIDYNSKASKDDKIHIINISYGFYGYAEDMAAKIRQLYKDGVLIVSSAGNNMQALDVSFPAYMPEVISAGALSALNWISNYSSYHPQKNLVDFLAPGEEVYAFYPAENMYYASNGTSLASAYVSGLAALAVEKYKRAHAGAYPSPARVKKMLADAAEPLQGVPVQRQGAGIINAGKI